MHNSFAESYLTILMWYSHYEFTCLKIQTVLKYGCIHTDYKIRNPSTLHFHAFFVCKTVAYIEKRRQNVTPGLFFSCKFIVVYRFFFHCFFFSWKGQGWYMQTQIVHFACLGSIWVHEFSTIKGGVEVPVAAVLRCRCWEGWFGAGVDLALLVWRAFHEQMLRESVLWPRLWSVWTLSSVKLKEKLNSGHGYTARTGIWCWNYTEYNSELISRKLEVPDTFLKKLRRALLCHSS